ncbi:hypothetical protein B7O87_05840 [Cylindrospermopsis raciborskii CENA303]|uniref:Uncharacterized protein n=1 Tax=Cylindrospermopsis raciborskii CENA303 TaxID=1170769 RepID=A0A1X4G971_9CYAN|nr:hypothetical protein CRD_01570 [Raphidiopsis brookii D9]OSO93307.1 hypothetical protein B7O87_05840 [Cylindrospermopsis raciborskii CENA303]
MSLMDVVTFTLFNAVACIVLPKLISIVFPIHKTRIESKPIKTPKSQPATEAVQQISGFSYSNSSF